MKSLRLLMSVCLLLTTLPAAATTDVTSSPSSSTTAVETINTPATNLSGAAKTALNNEPPRTTTESQAYSPMHILRSLLALIVVLGGLFAVSRFLQRRTVSFVKNSGQRVRIIERRYLSHKHSLLLVAIDNEEFLLAVGPEQTNKVWEKKKYEGNTTT